MTTVNFYHDLPALVSFAEAIETARHVVVPGDWWIVGADVVGSTRAIEAGAYRKVNTVGVACIAAVVNVDRSIDLPFVSGGDGPTFAVLDGLRERVIPALREAQRLARESFDLLLRVGLVPVSELLGAGLPVRLAKVRLSPNVTQPTFCGRGWDEAERMVKDPLAHGVLRVREEEGPREGFQIEPRTFPIPERAALVEALAGDGCSQIQVASFVSPKQVPQMAD